MKDINECHKDFLEYRSLFEQLKRTNLTESDTRSKIIDKIFIDVLNWSEELINREGYVIEGYYDYLFTIPNFQFIVEAKKAFIDFILPNKNTAVTIGTIEKSNKEVISQIRKYLYEMGLQYAVVTNGHQFIIGKFSNTDGTDWRKNRCLIFNGFDDIDTRFIEFYNILSKFSNAENIGFKVYLEEFVQYKGKTVLSTLPLKDSELIRNSLSAELTPIINKLFGELYDIDEAINKELIKECFIENNEIKKNKSEIERLFDDTPPKVENIVKARNTESIATQIKEEIKDDDLKLSSNPPQPIIIVGSKGAGKTTFINYLFKYDIDSEKDFSKNHPYIYLDFRNYSGTKKSFENSIFDDILEQIYEKYSILNLNSNTSLHSIYHKEIDRNNKSIWQYDKENNIQSYQTKLDSFITEKLKDSENHFFKLSEHLIKGRRIRLCIVIDNADQFEIEIQKSVFLFAQSLNRKGNVTIILSLREGYYYKWRYLPPFDAFPCNVYHITAPPYKEVLQKRIDYVLNKIEVKGKTKGIVSNNKTFIIQNDSVRKFLLSLRTSLFGSNNSDMLQFIEETTYPNIREGLEIFKQFLISGHTEVHQYVLRQESSPNAIQPIPYWEFIKAISLNNKKYYNHNISIVNNIFYPTEGSRNHFLKIKILNFLDYKLINGGLSEKYFNVGELINSFENTGYISKIVRNELNELCKYRLVESENQLSDVEDTTILTMGDSVCISMKGHHYINTLVNNFTYIEMVLEDTPLFNEEDFYKLKTDFPLSDDLGKRDIYARITVVEDFLNYLEKEEKSETFESKIFGKSIVSRIKYGVNKDIFRIRKKYNN